MEWLQKRLHAAKESWEKIVLDEVFVFSGGLEGSWRRDDGWGITHRTKASTPGEDAHGEKARIGVLLEGERVRAFLVPMSFARVNTQHDSGNPGGTTKDRIVQQIPRINSPRPPKRF